MEENKTFNNKITDNYLSDSSYEEEVVLSRKERNRFVFESFADKLSKVKIRFSENITNNMTFKGVEGKQNQESLSFAEQESNFKEHLVSEKAVNLTPEFVSLVDKLLPLSERYISVIKNSTIIFDILFENLINEVNSQENKYNSNNIDFNKEKNNNTNNNAYTEDTETNDVDIREILQDNKFLEEEDNRTMIQTTPKLYRFRTIFNNANFDYSVLFISSTLELIVSLVKDVRESNEHINKTILEVIFPIVVKIVSSSQKAEDIDKCFSLLVNFIKLLSKRIGSNNYFKEFISNYSPLVFNKKSFIRKFSAESLVFIFKNLDYENIDLSFIINEYLINENNDTPRNSDTTNNVLDDLDLSSSIEKILLNKYSIIYNKDKSDYFSNCLVEIFLVNGNQISPFAEKHYEKILKALFNNKNINSNINTLSSTLFIIQVLLKLHNRTFYSLLKTIGGNNNKMLNSTSIKNNRYFVLDFLVIYYNYISNINNTDTRIKYNEVSSLSLEKKSLMIKSMFECNNNNAEVSFILKLGYNILMREMLLQYFFKNSFNINSDKAHYSYSVNTFNNRFSLEKELVRSYFNFITERNSCDSNKANWNKEKDVISNIEYEVLALMIYDNSGNVLVELAKDKLETFVANDNNNILIKLYSNMIKYYSYVGVNKINQFSYYEYKHSFISQSETTDNKEIKDNQEITENKMTKISSLDENDYQNNKKYLETVDLTAIKDLFAQILNSLFEILITKINAFNKSENSSSIEVDLFLSTALNYLSYYNSLKVKYITDNEQNITNYVGKEDSLDIRININDESNIKIIADYINKNFINSDFNNNDSTCKDLIYKSLLNLEIYNLFNINNTHKQRYLYLLNQLFILVKDLTRKIEINQSNYNSLYSKSNSNSNEDNLVWLAELFCYKLNHNKQTFFMISEILNNLILKTIMSLDSNSINEFMMEKLLKDNIDSCYKSFFTNLFTKPSGLRILSKLTSKNIISMHNHCFNNNSDIFTIIKTHFLKFLLSPEVKDRLATISLISNILGEKNTSSDSNNEYSSYFNIIKEKLHTVFTRICYIKKEVKNSKEFLMNIENISILIEELSSYISNKKEFSLEEQVFIIKYVFYYLVGCYWINFTKEVWPSILRALTKLLSVTKSLFITKINKDNHLFICKEFKDLLKLYDDFILFIKKFSSSEEMMKRYNHILKYYYLPFSNVKSEGISLLLYEKNSESDNKNNTNSDSLLTYNSYLKTTLFSFVEINYLNNLNTNSSLNTSLSVSEGDYEIENEIINISNKLGIYFSGVISSLESVGSLLCLETYNSVFKRKDEDKQRDYLNNSEYYTIVNSSFEFLNTHLLTLKYESNQIKFRSLLEKESNHDNVYSNYNEAVSFNDSQYHINLYYNYCLETYYSTTNSSSSLLQIKLIENILILILNIEIEKDDKDANTTNNNDKEYNKKITDEVRNITFVSLNKDFLKDILFELIINSKNIETQKLSIQILSKLSLVVYQYNDLLTKVITNSNVIEEMYNLDTIKNKFSKNTITPEERKELIPLLIRLYYSKYFNLFDANKKKQKTRNKSNLGTFFIQLSDEEMNYYFNMIIKDVFGNSRKGNNNNNNNNSNNDSTMLIDSHSDTNTDFNATIYKSVSDINKEIEFLNVMKLRNLLDIIISNFKQLKSKFRDFSLQLVSLLTTVLCFNKTSSEYYSIINKNNDSSFIKSVEKTIFDFCNEANTTSNNTELMELFNSPLVVGYTKHYLRVSRELRKKMFTILKLVYLSFNKTDNEREILTYFLNQHLWKTFSSSITSDLRLSSDPQTNNILEFFTSLSSSYKTHFLFETNIEIANSIIDIINNDLISKDITFKIIEFIENLIEPYHSYLEYWEKRNQLKEKDSKYATWMNLDNSDIEEDDDDDELLYLEENQYNNDDMDNDGNNKIKVSDKFGKLSGKNKLKQSHLYSKDITQSLIPYHFFKNINMFVIKLLNRRNLTNSLNSNFTVRIVEMILKNWTLIQDSSRTFFSSSNINDNNDNNNKLINTINTLVYYQSLPQETIVLFEYFISFFEKKNNMNNEDYFISSFNRKLFFSDNEGFLFNLLKIIHFIIVLIKKNNNVNNNYSIETYINSFIHLLYEINEINTRIVLILILGEFTTIKESVANVLLKLNQKKQQSNVIDSSQVEESVVFETLNELINENNIVISLPDFEPILYQMFYFIKTGDYSLQAISFKKIKIIISNLIEILFHNSAELKNSAFQVFSSIITVLYSLLKFNQNASCLTYFTQIISYFMLTVSTKIHKLEEEMGKEEVYLIYCDHITIIKKILCFDLVFNLKDIIAITEYLKNDDIDEECHTTEEVSKRRNSIKSNKSSKSMKSNKSNKDNKDTDLMLNEDKERKDSEDYINISKINKNTNTNKNDTKTKKTKQKQASNFILEEDDLSLLEGLMHTKLSIRVKSLECLIEILKVSNYYHNFSKNTNDPNILNKLSKINKLSSRRQSDVSLLKSSLFDNNSINKTIISQLTNIISTKIEEKSLLLLILPIVKFNLSFDAYSSHNSSKNFSVFTETKELDKLMANSVDVVRLVTQRLSLMNQSDLFLHFFSSIQRNKNFNFKSSNMSIDPMKNLYKVFAYMLEELPLKSNCIKEDLRKGLLNHYYKNYTSYNLFNKLKLNNFDNYDKHEFNENSKMVIEESDSEDESSENGDDDDDDKENLKFDNLKKKYNSKNYAKNNKNNNKEDKKFNIQKAKPLNPLEINAKLTDIRLEDSKALIFTVKNLFRKKMNERDNKRKERDNKRNNLNQKEDNTNTAANINIVNNTNELSFKDKKIMYFLNSHLTSKVLPLLRDVSIVNARKENKHSYYMNNSTLKAYCLTFLMLRPFDFQKEFLKVVYDLISNLKNREHHVREKAREGFLIVMETIGIETLPIIINELKMQLHSGYQKFLLCHVINFLISNAKKILNAKKALLHENTTKTNSSSIAINGDKDISLEVNKELEELEKLYLNDTIQLSKVTTPNITLGKKDDSIDKTNIIFDAIMINSTEILLDELFGDTAEDKQSIIAQKYPESKKSNAIDSFSHLTENLSCEDTICLMIYAIWDFVSKIELCSETQTKVGALLGRISNSLRNNSLIDFKSLFYFSYGLLALNYEENISKEESINKRNNVIIKGVRGLDIDNYNHASHSDKYDSNYTLQKGIGNYNRETVNSIASSNKNKNESLLRNEIISLGIDIFSVSVKSILNYDDIDVNNRNDNFNDQINQVLKASLQAITTQLKFTNYEKLIHKSLRFFIFIINFNNQQYIELVKPYSKILLGVIFKNINSTQNVELTQTILKLLGDIINKKLDTVELKNHQLEAILKFSKLNVNKPEYRIHIYSCLLTMLKNKVLHTDIMDIIDLVLEKYIEAYENNIREICSIIVLEFFTNYIGEVAEYMLNKEVKTKDNKSKYDKDSKDYKKVTDSVSKIIFSWQEKCFNILIINSESSNTRYSHNSLRLLNYLLLNPSVKLSSSLIEITFFKFISLFVNERLNKDTKKELERFYLILLNGISIDSNTSTKNSYSKVKNSRDIVSINKLDSLFSEDNSINLELNQLTYYDDTDSNLKLHSSKLLNSIIPSIKNSLMNNMKNYFSCPNQETKLALRAYLEFTAVFFRSKLSKDEITEYSAISNDNNNSNKRKKFNNGSTNTDSKNLISLLVDIIYFENHRVEKLIQQHVEETEDEVGELIKINIPHWDIQYIALNIFEKLLIKNKTTSFGNESRETHTKTVNNDNTIEYEIESHYKEIAEYLHHKANNNQINNNKIQHNALYSSNFKLPINDFSLLYQFFRSIEHPNFLIKSVSVRISYSIISHIKESFSNDNHKHRNNFYNFVAAFTSSKMKFREKSIMEHLLLNSSLLLMQPRINENTLSTLMKLIFFLVKEVVYTVYYCADENQELNCNCIVEPFQDFIRELLSESRAYINYNNSSAFAIAERVNKVLSVMVNLIIKVNASMRTDNTTLSGLITSVLDYCNKLDEIKAVKYNLKENNYSVIKSIQEYLGDSLFLKTNNEVKKNQILLKKKRKIEKVNKKNKE